MLLSIVTFAAAFLVLIKLASLFKKHVLVPSYYFRTGPELEGKGEEGMKFRIEQQGNNRKELPHPFPNGWFKGCDSHELLPGSIKAVPMFGKNLILVKTPLDEQKLCGVCAVDSDDPKVKAILEEKNPDLSQLEEVAKNSEPYWWVREVNMFVLVWHHSEGLEPQWEVPVIPELNEGGDYYYHGRSDHHVEALCQEVPENGADIAHLNYLHHPSFVPLITKLWNHSWAVSSWAPGTPEKHITSIELTEQLHFCGKYVPGTRVYVSIQQIGPGLVYLRFKTPAGVMIIGQGVTPQLPLRQQVSHAIYGKLYNRPIAKFILYGVVFQFELDVKIWNNKLYLANPVLSKEDKCIPAFRRWYSQFYSKNTPYVWS